MRPITDVAQDLGLAEADLVTYGPSVAKLTLPAVRRLEAAGPRARIILVSAMNPTPHGEGKTTVSIGLGQGLRALKRKVALALREPSLGPIFGVKGGGTGGGKSQLQPGARINLHFTGDFHAITAAHNLLAALADNAAYFRSPLDLDPRQLTWPRVMDMNERFLRRIVTGLGGKANGIPKEDSFDITAASEVMAVLCLSRNLADLKARLGKITVGSSRDGKPVTAAQLEAQGAMAALLADAAQPNLVQSTEGCPAFVHGGPFGNIAHGCNSIIATRSAAACADYVVTEAGFGFELGAEKFFDIKCRTAQIWPSGVVLVATVQALRYHGGDLKKEASGADALKAIERGFANLDQHLKSARAFGFEPVVALNRFPTDTEAELQAVEAGCRERKLRMARFTGFADGSAGATELASRVLEATEGPAPAPRFMYALEDSPEAKITAVATRVYGAAGVTFTKEAKDDITRAMALGAATFPVCLAKTHLSLSDDSTRFGQPKDFQLTVRKVRAATGAGYLLALTGDILTMPGLPKVPASTHIDLTDDGEIVGVV